MFSLDVKEAILLFQANEMAVILHIDKAYLTGHILSFGNCASHRHVTQVYRTNQLGATRKQNNKVKLFN